MPKISVVIPVYNVEKYIRQCLDSAINQTLEDIEIICVDDGSTDSCPQILDEYAAKDTRIKVIHKKNSGYGHSMNVGMDAATGKYFAILESDDIIHLKMYEELYEIAERYQVDIVKADFCRFKINDGVMVCEQAKIAKPHLYNRVLNADRDAQSIIMDASLYTWSGIYKRSFLYENGIRHNETPGASYQDNGFWFQTMASAQSVYFVDRSYYMLRRDNPNSSVMSRGKVYCVRDEYEFVLQFLKDRPELYSKTIKYYWWARFGAYRYSYRRIAEEYKMEFLLHFQQVFSQVETTELDQNIFARKSWNDLQEILRNPEHFNAKHEKETQRLTQPRTKWNRLMWCYQDNGLKYTIVHILERVGSKVGIKSKKEQFKIYSVKPISKDIRSIERNLSHRMDDIVGTLELQSEQMKQIIKQQELLLQLYTMRESATKKEAEEV